MRTSPWLSAAFARLTDRERVVVAAGAGVSGLALFAVLVVLPLGRHWREREDRIALRADQLARLEDLVGREAELRQRRADLDRASASAGRQLLEGETPAVAASTLQLLLNRYAAESRVTLERVDAVNQPGGQEEGITEIPARIAVSGDIYGLVDLLFYVQNGDKLLVVDDLRAQQARLGPGGEALLAISVSLHGYYRARGGRP